MSLVQVLPQDWSSVTVCWVGWQDQDVGCERQWQVHAHIHGLHQGVQPGLIVCAVCKICVRCPRLCDNIAMSLSVRAVDGMCLFALLYSGVCI